MGQPLEVTAAIVAVSMGERFGQLPATILDADARNMGLVEIANLMANPPKQTPKGKEATRGEQ